MTEIVTCVSCDGYGWLDDEDGSAAYCEWCGGVGYVYRDERGVIRRIPDADFAVVSDQLEALEAERLRQMGYSGAAKKPWEQAVRQPRNPNSDL